MLEAITELLLSIPFTPSFISDKEKDLRDRRNSVKHLLLELKPQKVKTKKVFQKKNYLTK